jgi:hypothetical protein
MRWGLRIGEETTDEAVLGELGRRLAQVRLGKNLTQAQLAAKAGVSKRTVERLEVREIDCTFLFRDGDIFTFMDSTTFDQFNVPGELLGEKAAFLQDNMEVSVNFIEGKAGAEGSGGKQGDDGLHEEPSGCGHPEAGRPEISTLRCGSR